MRRIKLKIQYDGTLYNGWQLQPHGTTIQGLLQEAIFKLTGERTNVAGAGRTDAGVHAIGQVATFDSLSLLSNKVMKRGLNALLPGDVRIMDIEDTASDFHPRYCARSKRYIYIIANMDDNPVFFGNYAWWIRAPLDLSSMKTAADYICGSHDFSSFKGSGCGAKNPVRNVYSLEVEGFNEMKFLFASFSGNYIKLSMEADGFLRHMVRNIVGTLVGVGKSKIKPEKMNEILKAKDRRLAGPTAPAKGLFLEKVIYDL